MNARQFCHKWKFKEKRHGSADKCGNNMERMWKMRKF